MEEKKELGVGQFIKGIIIILFIVVIIIVFVKVGFHQKDSTKKEIPEQYIIREGDDVLKSYSDVWASSLDLMKYVDLIIYDDKKIAHNFFSSMVTKKMAFKTDVDIPVIVVDHITYREASLYKLTTKDGKDGGWVMGYSIEFYKKKR